MVAPENFGSAWSSIGTEIARELSEQISVLAAAIAREAAKLEKETEQKQKQEATQRAMATARAQKDAVEDSMDAWRRVVWDEAQQRYLARLKEHVSTTRLLGNSKPVRIDQLYTDVFVYEQMSAVRRTSLSLANPGVDPYTFHVPYERKSALDVVGRGGDVYVLGHPGAGKTTFLKYLTILACESSIARTPVYIPLRDVMQLKKTVRGYMEREFDICGLPDAAKFCEELLSNTDTLLLVDGLDEVQDSAELRSDLIHELIELARRFPRAQLVLTCRIAASDYAFEQFTYCEVAEFTVEQQKSFIKKWYGSEDVARNNLLSSWELPRMASLRDLAKTPLLLALICLAFDEDGEIPERRTDLYRDSIETLLKRWDSSRSIRRDPFYGGLTSVRREQLLQELASTFHGQNRILFSPDVAAPVINGWFAKLPDPPPHDTGATEELLDQIEAQHGLVVQRAAGIYSFSHLSLQEFFAARSIAHGHPFNTVERIVSSHFSEPRWREVFVFLAGLLPDGSGMLEQLRTSAARTASASRDVNQLLTFVMVTYREREGPWRGGGYKDKSDAAMFYAGKSPPIIALNSLRHRLRELSWMRADSGLFLKLAIAEEILLMADRQPGHILARSVNSSELNSYFQAAALAVDCAAVAVCDNRERAVSWILMPPYS